MMRWIGRALLALVAAAAGYLAFWPGPVDPSAWTPAPDQGFTGAFAANERLAGVEALGLGGLHGPEDLALTPDGAVVVGVHEGPILRLDGDRFTEIARVEGRPLGLEAAADGALYVADAYHGLVRIEPGGAQSLVATEAGGAPILYANDVAIGPDGLVYLSDSTARFAPAALGGTLPASILDIAEHRQTGRLLVHDPRTGETRVLAEGFSFANGIALSRTGDWLALAETAAYRVWRIWLAGPRQGEREILVDNLPGFPDNIERDAEGRFWIGLGSPRRAVVDALAPYPWARAAVMKLPDGLRPGPKPYGALIAVNAEGEVVANLQDTSGAHALATAAQIVGDQLYISNLAGDALWRLPLAEALE